MYAHIKPICYTQRVKVAMHRRAPLFFFPFLARKISPSFVALQLELCLQNDATESRHKAHTLKKRSFLEKQLWQEIENKSGCIYPLSGHVIVRRESVEREETGLGLYVRCKIGETNFHLLPPHPRHSA